MNKRSISFLIAVGCTLLTTACQPIQPLSESSAKVTTTTVTTAPATTAASLQERYAAALQDANIAEADEVFDGLTVISADNADLQWQADSNRVLMVTWTSWDGYDTQMGKEIQLAREVWVTAVPQLQSFCQSYQATAEVPLALRMEELLGLPPNNGKSRMVEMWVNPDDLFRPSPDGEINDTVAELEMPTADHFPSQQAYEFHRDWFNLQLTLDNYDDPSKGYPWTRLGYTFDWGNPKSEIGLSEFVISASSTVTIEKVYSNDEYCGK